MKIISLIMLAIGFLACNAPGPPFDTSQIANYVVSVFEDSQGHLWMGTLEKGVARYDGTDLKYFTINDGLPSNRVTTTVEDAQGDLWFGTGEGLSKYDGNHFTNFPIGADFSTNSISCLLIDEQGIFWIGTWAGVYQFNGSDFTPFSIPVPEVNTPINEDTKNWITTITQDTVGNIWFARDGYGACRYDGQSFTHYLKRDGLYSNNVTEIEIDGQGDLWLGSRVAEKDDPNPERRKGEGGITKIEGVNYLHFPEVAGFNQADVYEIYRDHADQVWISTLSHGVYQYDGTDFKNYKIPISIMSITQDKKGNLWLGGAGGLYHIDQDGKIVNVTQNGPWK